MASLLRVAATRAPSLSARAPAFNLARGFKTKATERAKKAAAASAEDKANRGRDPYGLFKSAISSEPERQAKTNSGTWREHRAAYSREKMHEHHRVGAHFTQLIKMRNAALEALPEELQAEARAADYTLIPIERRVFTETAPIADFQDKCTRTAAATDSS